MKKIVVTFEPLEPFGLPLWITDNDADNDFLRLKIGFIILIIPLSAGKRECWMMG
jgi:hypothetical protein